MNTFTKTANVEFASETEEIKIDVKIVFTSKNADVTELQKLTINELKNNIELYLLDLGQ